MIRAGRLCVVQCIYTDKLCKLKSESLMLQSGCCKEQKAGRYALASPNRDQTTAGKDIAMEVVSRTDARSNLDALMTKVCENHDIAIITRKGKPSVVMMSLEEYESWQETAYLMSTPANARHLLDGIAQLDAGKGEAMDTQHSSTLGGSTGD